MHPVLEMPIGKMESRNGYFFYRLNPYAVIVEDGEGIKQPELQYRTGICLTIDEAVKRYDQL